MDRMWVATVKRLFFNSQLSSVTIIVINDSLVNKKECSAMPAGIHFMKQAKITHIFLLKN
jgi:hypothetical protein